MLGLIGGVLKTIGLRSAAGLLGFFDSAKWLLIAGAAVIAVLWATAEYGRWVEQQERAVQEAIARERARTEFQETSRILEERARSDKAELAAIEKQEARLRDETSDDNGAVLWDTDDRWLRSKR